MGVGEVVVQEFWVGTWLRGREERGEWEDWDECENWEEREERGG